MNWKPIRDEVVQLLKSGRKQDAILITKEKGAHHVARLEAKTLDLTAYARKKATGFLEFAEKRQSDLENITLILTIAGVFISVAIAFIATSLVVKAEKVLMDEKTLP